MSHTAVQLALGLAVAATGLGILVAAFGFAIAESRGASLGDVLMLTLVYVMFVGLYGLVVGGPLAIVSSLAATWLLRTAASRLERWWPIGAVTVAVVAIAASAALLSTIATARDTAALLGDRVPFEYEILNESKRPYELQIRSYWDGEVGGGSSSSFVGEGCSSGAGSLQSDWAVWLTQPSLEWQDRPDGEPVVTSADHRGGNVYLRIQIAQDGEVSMQLGRGSGTPRGCSAPTFLGESWVMT